jgi:hypothetical protein
MLRSQSNNVTVIDRAIYLWVLCTIEWMHENNEPISNNNLDRLFGHETKRRFNFYREIAMEWKDLGPGGLILTPKGQRIVNNWKSHLLRIMDV